MDEHPQLAMFDAESLLRDAVRLLSDIVEKRNMRFGEISKRADLFRVNDCRQVLLLCAIPCRFGQLTRAFAEV